MDGKKTGVASGFLLVSFGDVGPGIFQARDWRGLQSGGEGSEGGDVYLKNFTYLGEKYTDVLSYPGGNPVGTIYKYGSSKPFATNGDGSISCVD